MNRTVHVPHPPKRIISLVPSQTELLYDLGLDEEVIGITKFCVHPEEWYRQKSRIGGTKKYKKERIEELNPDLIIGNKEEGHEDRIKALMEEYPVWMSNIYTLEDALDMIKRIGVLVDQSDRAEELVHDVSDSFAELPSLTHLSVAYFIWRDPLMVAGNHTFIDHLLSRLGLRNVYGSYERYPATTLEELAGHQPDLIFLSSEPYPFKEKHFHEFREACPHSQVLIVNGEFFSWYGSRLRRAVSYFRQLTDAISARAPS